MSPAGAGDSSVRALARPKSSTFDDPIGRDLDIGRLQIAVNDSLLVRRVERIGDLPRNRQCLAHRQRARRQALGERLTLDQLENQPMNAVALLEPVDGADVRMIQRGQQPRLALEPRAAIRRPP